MGIAETICNFVLLFTNKLQITLLVIEKLPRKKYLFILLVF
jgi:hypothetical protein